MQTHNHQPEDDAAGHQTTASRAKPINISLQLEKLSFEASLGIISNPFTFYAFLITCVNDKITKKSIIISMTQQQFSL